MFFKLIETLRSAFASPVAEVWRFVARLSWVMFFTGLLYPDHGASGPAVWLFAFMAVVASLSFFTWDSFVPLSGSRLSLYGLTIAGEALAMLVVLAAVLGPPGGVAAWHALPAAALAAVLLIVPREMLFTSMMESMQAALEAGQVVDGTNSEEKDNTP